MYSLKERSVWMTPKNALLNDLQELSDAICKQTKDAIGFVYRKKPWEKKFLSFFFFLSSGKLKALDLGMLESICAMVCPILLPEVQKDSIQMVTKKIMPLFHMDSL